MKIDPGIYIVMHFVFFGKTGVTGFEMGKVDETMFLLRQGDDILIV
jgi:hypothetical protein